ncbi:MAG: ABC transporter ATP-binding protein [Planctomycetes bacterium]|nr:ABC transporter ATP-binding protein [Planctomycetota bacterium]
MLSWPMPQVLSTASDRKIQVREISRRFGPKVALHPTSFEVGPGGVTALLGPNGSGKSTLLRCIVGLVRPDSGSVTLDGVELSGDGTAVRRRTTFAPGEISLYTELRGREHLSWLLRGREREAVAVAESLADALGLPLDHRVRTYSHGMKRQLLFCAAMAPRVPVRILDEPSEGLDPSRRGAILELIERDAARGTTILLSSHHLGEVDRASSRMLFLHQGRLVRSEDSAGVRAQAARTLRLDYGSALEIPERAAAILAVLEGLGGQGKGPSPGPVRAVVRGRRAIVTLPEGDPRALLALIFAQRDLPPPESVEYGQLSLAELYRDVYGVEAV